MAVPRHAMAGALLALVLLAGGVAAGAGVDLERLHDIPSTCQAITLTAREDALDRSFLYVAAKDGGLRIFDVSGAPALVRTLDHRDLGGLDVMSLSQSGHRLYLALGTHWGRGQPPGLAVVDVGDPRRARVAGLWKDAGARGGAGVVEAVGDLAYLGAMGNGLVILDVRDPAAIREVSRIVPDRAYPDRRFDPAKINARGLAVRDDRVYLCYDAGGLRVIDVRNPARPVEIGRWSNPAMAGRPRAYNNLALDGTVAYVTVDYVGLEILDVSKPSAIRLLSWWNPWNPGRGGLGWFTSAGHANEIALDPKARLVFVSAGRSDLQVLDVADPAHPRLAGSYGKVADTEGTWGVSRHRDRLYLSYICTLGIPFRGTWTGIRMLRYRAPSPGAGS